MKFGGHGILLTQSSQTSARKFVCFFFFLGGGGWPTHPRAEPQPTRKHVPRALLERESSWSCTGSCSHLLCHICETECWTPENWRNPASRRQGVRFVCLAVAWLTILYTCSLPHNLFSCSAQPSQPAPAVTTHTGHQASRTRNHEELKEGYATA